MGDTRRIQQMFFTIPARPYPYTRTTQRKQYVDPAWKQYLASRDEVRLHVIEQMTANGWVMFPRRTRLAIRIALATGRENYHNRDGDNELKTVLDALQGHVFHNDAWVDDIRFTRCGSEEPKCTIYIEAISEKMLQSMAEALGLWLKEAFNYG